MKRVINMVTRITVGKNKYVIGKTTGMYGNVFWSVQRNGAIPKIFTDKSDIPYSFPNLKGKKY